jgi:hypothetical protein
LPTSSSVRPSARRSLPPSPRRSPRAIRMLPFLYVLSAYPLKLLSYNLLTTTQAKNHGNEPSKGAKIDQELREEEEAELKKKGNFGPK